MKRLLRIALPLVLGALLFLLIPSLFRSCRRPSAPVPFELSRPPARLLAVMPDARRFDWPIGSQHGGLTYNAQPFGVRDVSPRPHLGDDLNGCYGYNSDFGDPVRAVGDGLVIHALDAGGGWGRIVILLHRLPSPPGKPPRYVQSFYAHLDEIRVWLHDPVHRGQIIGTIGDAGGQYYAHLHFEMREFVNPFIGPGYREDLTGWINPSGFLREHRGAPDDNLALPLVRQINLFFFE